MSISSNLEKDQASWSASKRSCIPEEPCLQRLEHGPSYPDANDHREGKLGTKLEPIFTHA